MEKAHALFNSLVAEKRHEEIGLVVIDEIHMIGNSLFNSRTGCKVCPKIVFFFCTYFIGLSKQIFHDLKKKKIEFGRIGLLKKEKHWSYCAYRRYILPTVCLYC
jgi:hypothetical protein